MDNLTPITREEILMNDEPLTPITREEKILAGEDLTPVTRREYFLKKYRHAGGDVMVEGLEVTANGTYTAPEGKAYSPVEVAVPLPENAYLLKTASGSLVSFSDGADLPMPSFICNIDANQDLHGYDAPWPAGGGKNKLPMTVDGIKAANGGANTWTNNEKTISGITFSILTDNNGEIIGVNANGTATADAVVTILVDTSKVYGDSYFVGCNGGSNNTYNALIWDATNSARAKKWDGTTSSNNSIDGTLQQVKIEQGNTVKFQLRVMNGQTVNNITFYPMICLSTETDATFAPYENICPISGHTGVNAWVRGKNLVNWKWNAFNNDKMEIFLKGGTYTLSAESTLSDGKGYIRGTKPSGEYVSREELGLISWSATTTSGLYYGGSAQQQTYTFNVPNGGAKIEFGKINNNGTISAQLESGSTASTYEPYNLNSQTIQVSWQTEAGEVFGGYVDLVSGVLTVDKAGVDMGTLTWIKDSSANNSRYVAQRSGIKSNSTIISDIFKPATYSEVYYHRVDEAIATHDTYAQIVIHSSTFEAEYDADGFKTQMSGHYAVYELATPISYQLTPQQIKSLRGNNNAWCSTGDVDIDYFAKEVTG